MSPMPAKGVPDAPYNTPAPDGRLVACLHCDLLQRLPALAAGESVGHRLATLAITTA